MRKVTLPLLLALACAFPVTASAHALSAGAALEKAYDVARTIYLDDGDALDYGVERCDRVNRHRFRCTIGVWFDYNLDADNYCTRTVSIRYRSSRSHRLHVWKGKWTCELQERFPF